MKITQRSTYFLVHAYIRSHSKRARTHITAKLLFVCLNLIHNKFWVCVYVCVYVFDRFSILCCFMFLIDSVLLPLLDAYCECRNGFVRFFSFIIDIISLVFVLLFQFPYVLTRFTLCNVAIYSMYNYLSLLTVPRSFCFLFYSSIN